jgi:hypothetical protein
MSNLLVIQGGRVFSTPAPLNPYEKEVFMAPMKNPAATKKGRAGSPVKKGKTLTKKERRKYPRYHFKLPMNYSMPDNKDNYGGIIGNASEGGIEVHLPGKLDTGEVLKIEILFAKGWELKTVRGIAKIIWSDLAVRKTSKVHRYGLQFQLFNKRNLQKLRILLKEASQ